VVIVSNSRVFIEQSRFLFETLWGKAVPAEQRIRELEEGAPVETTLPIEGAENVLRAMLAMRANAKKRVDIYMHANGVSLTAGMDQLREGLPKLKERGVRVRYLTEITKDNLQYCKQLAALAAMEMRHTTGLKGNFGINETEYITIDPFIGGELPARGLYSNNRVMVYQQQQYFDTLWQRATPAQERMREIEEGVEPEFIEIINDGVRAAELMMDFARSVRKEAQLILPSPKTMARTEKLGVWNLLVDAANSHGAEIRIITPITEENAALARQITDRAPGIKMLKGPASATGLFVQDGKRYFRAEYRNPDAGEVAEAISRVVYSNSASGVKSFKSIFETLWKQSELYEALRVANEKLVLQDRMQKEFINIAAHELRTPIQPILGVANLKAAEFADGKEEAASITKTEMEIISRNAKRLQRLSSDILEMARIEGGQFRLNVEEFDLDDVILPLVQDAQSEASSSGKALKISYSAPLARRGHLVLKGDKGRITEVIWNLLNNAIKFSESGTISISAEKGNIDGGPVAVVTVRDTGRGIDPDILPRLFGKFVTKSDKGTGLGLYISKSIVEAHGGKIWAQNNADGKGATFTFTLPLG
jgi:signal transduction histidine kinase